MKGHLDFCFVTFEFLFKFFGGLFVVNYMFERYPGIINIITFSLIYLFWMFYPFILGMIKYFEFLGFKTINQPAKNKLE